MIIEKAFSVLHAVVFNHQYVEITYINSLAYTKKTTSKLEIKRNWCYPYDDGKLLEIIGIAKNNMRNIKHSKNFKTFELPNNEWTCCLLDNTFILNKIDIYWFKTLSSLTYLQLWYKNTIFDKKIKNMSKYIPYIQDKRFVSGKEMFSTIQNKETVSSLLYKYKQKNIITKV